ncbi:uncharacterized oxidoreductase SAR2567 [Arthrobacter sp. Hiyo1]|nr:uncharacterized oxidoreductase SAR2567 [Arthrobacter sp. Hiyo1]
MSETILTRPRVAVVTGAGSGIGRAVARLLLAEGYSVALAGRREAQLLETANGHPEALAVPCDVTVPTTSRAFSRRPAGAGGGLMSCSITPASSASGGVDEISVADWNATLSVNVTGSMLCAAEAVRTMRRRSRKADASSTTAPSQPIRRGHCPSRTP